MIKWFSNFREFYYIQMEKFARQAISDGVTDPEVLVVLRDSELFRALNLHYNKGNDFEVRPCTWSQEVAVSGKTPFCVCPYVTESQGNPGPIFYHLQRLQSQYLLLGRRQADAADGIHSQSSL